MSFRFENLFQGSISIILIIWCFLFRLWLTQKGMRFSFPPEAFQILQGIIKNYDGGRFLEVIRDRSVGRNREKQGVWMEVTALFNKVSVE